MERGIVEKLNNTTLKTAAAAAAVGSIIVPVVDAEQSPQPSAPPNMEEGQAKIKTHRYRTFTGFVVRGRTSTFGWPAESDGQTADGGSTQRACIALRSHSTLGHLFKVRVGHHRAVMRQCDWGPAAWTGRNIDLTGAAARKLDMNPFRYPTGVHGVAREIRRHKKHSVKVSF